MDPEQRTHNPLVLGSNPSGPTNQLVEAAVVPKIGVSDSRSSTGQLKLFSQLIETVTCFPQRNCLVDLLQSRALFRDQIARFQVANTARGKRSFQESSYLWRPSPLANLD
jgi:hypothetical protein